MTLFPPNLKKNDLILIISPAGAVSPCQLSFGISYLQDLGFRTEEGKFLYHQEGPFAGSDNERASDLQWAINHPEAKAIWMARGGYGCIKCLPKVLWNKFSQHPKWFIGFSDITVLHQKLHHLQIASIHGPMVSQFQESQAMVDLTISLLRGEREPLKWKTEAKEQLKDLQGEIVGGNLSIISSLRGTSLDLNYEKKILIIEDVDEYHYHIDRMLENLSFGGVLDKIQALIIGTFTMIKEGNSPMPYSLEDNLIRLAQKHNFTLIPQAPIGHIDANHPIILGTKVRINTTQDEISIEYI